MALKKGRLHPNHWAEIGDLLLDSRSAEADQLLAQQITPEPALLCLGCGNSPMPDQQTTGGKQI
jgi:hypothetical protein